jgi:hypothetical protein
MYNPAIVSVTNLEIFNAEGVGEAVVKLALRGIG